ncbi:MAG: hypothetical protein ACE5K0_08680 [Candidatus Methanofastidiosia archaeon]
MLSLSLTASGIIEGTALITATLIVIVIVFDLGFKRRFSKKIFNHILFTLFVALLSNILYTLLNLSF